MSAHLRIETTANPSGRARVAKEERFIFVDEDGAETDISLIFYGAEIEMLAGKAITATLRTPFLRLVEVAP